MGARPTSSRQKGGHKRGNGEYRGVRFRNDKWISEIRVPKKPTRIWLGSHLSAEKAARAYDAALYCLKGEKGKFNFPNNARPDLSNRPIGSLLCPEIQCIALKFSSLEEDSVDTPVLSPPRNISPPRELTPPREVPQAVESTGVPTSVISNQLCESEVDLSEEPEPYIPKFSPEDPPYDPTFVPDGEYLAHQFPELDEWGLLDGDWLRYTKNAGLPKKKGL